MQFTKNHKSSFIIGLIFSIVSFVLFYKLGDSRLLDVDEPRYAEAAREMLENHNWLTPYFNYELRFDKPVFYYWTIAWSYITFGVNEFAARFPSALAGLLTVAMTFFFTDKTFNRKTAIYSSLILTTMIEPTIISRMSITDSTLSFFICSAIMTAFLGIEQHNHNKYYWWIAYIFCALGFLTKGPVALVLPVGIVGLYLLITKQLKNNLKGIYHLPGILLFLVIGLPWYFLMYQEHGQLFIDEFIIKHNLARFASSSFHHQQPFWFFVPVVLIGSFPWVCHLMTALWANITELFRNYKKENLFILLWAFGVFCFYSASKAKLLTYILPMFPALAIITAVFWSDFKTNFKTIKISTISLAVFSLVVGCVGIVLSATSFVPLNELLQTDTTQWIPYLTVLFVLTPILLLISVLKKKEVTTFSLMIVLFIVLLLTKFNIGDSIIYNLTQRDFDNYLNISAQYDNAQLYLWGTKKPSLTFYSKKKVTYIDKPYVDAVVSLLDSDNPVFIFTKQKRIEKEINKRLNNYKIIQGIKYSLITNIKDIKE